MPALVLVFFQDLLGSLLVFPFWWYGGGFIGVLHWMKQELAFRWRSYAVALWMKQFFVPMYGQYDWTGRFISAFVRFFVILARVIAIVVEAVVYVLFAIAWLMAPIAFLLLFLWNLTSSVAAFS